MPSQEQLFNPKYVFSERKKSEQETTYGWERETGIDENGLTKDFITQLSQALESDINDGKPKPIAFLNPEQNKEVEKIFSDKVKYNLEKARTTIDILNQQKNARIKEYEILMENQQDACLHLDESKQLQKQLDQAIKLASRNLNSLLECEFKKLDENQVLSIHRDLLYQKIEENKQKRLFRELGKFYAWLKKKPRLTTPNLFDNDFFKILTTLAKHKVSTDDTIDDITYNALQEIEKDLGLEKCDTTKLKQMVLPILEIYKGMGGAPSIGSDAAELEKKLQRPFEPHLIANKVTILNNSRTDDALRNFNDKVKWFKEFLTDDSVDIQEKKKVVRFITGSPTNPDNSDPIRIECHGGSDKKDATFLPVAHTCFNQLDINGTKQAKSDFLSKLIQAAEMTNDQAFYD